MHGAALRNRLVGARNGDRWRRPRHRVRIGLRVGWRLRRDAARESEHVVVVVAISATKEVLKADDGDAVLEEVHLTMDDPVGIALGGSEAVFVAAHSNPEDELDPGLEWPQFDDGAHLAVGGDEGLGTGFEQEQFARQTSGGRQHLDLDRPTR